MSENMTSQTKLPSGGRIERLENEILRLRLSIEQAAQRADGWPDSNDDPARVLADCADILYAALDKNSLR